MSFKSQRPSSSNLFGSNGDLIETLPSSPPEETEDNGGSEETAVDPLSFKGERLPLESLNARKPSFHVNTAQPEVYRVFSEDEEPVLRNTYAPHVIEPKFERKACDNERIVFFDVRNGVPDLNGMTRDEVKRAEPNDCETLQTQYYGAGPAPSLNDIDEKRSTAAFTTHFRKPTSGQRCPYEMKRQNLSMNELSDRELRVIRAIWGSIKFDLYMFGSLVTLNLFEILSHVKEADQKATPDRLQQCRILLPHAKLAMDGLNRAVDKFHEPWKGQDAVYEMGKAHDRLKIDLSQEQCELIINALLLTLAREIHPKLSLREMNVMRRFFRVVMNLLVEGSRWNRTPPDWLLHPVYANVQ